MSNTSEFGWAVAHTAGSGQALHIVRVTGSGWNEFAAASLCGTEPAVRYGANIRWMESGDSRYSTPAEAAAAQRTCKRCSAAAVKLAAAEAAALAAVEEIRQQADPETAAGQAWAAEQQATEQQQQADARAAALARADALGITAEAEPAAVETPAQAAEAEAEALTASVLAVYPTVQRFAISAHVFLDDRGYAVERTISRNVGRADLLAAFSRLVGQQQLSHLSAYADGFG